MEGNRNIIVSEDKCVLYLKSLQSNGGNHYEGKMQCRKYYDKKYHVSLYFTP